MGKTEGAQVSGGPWEPVPWEPVLNSVSSFPEGLGEEELCRLVCHKCMHEHTHIYHMHTYTHIHAHMHTRVSLSFFHIQTHACRYRHILTTRTQAHTPQLSAPCIHIHTHTLPPTHLPSTLTHTHCHTESPHSFSCAHCPQHTPSPCSFLGFPGPHEQRWGRSSLAPPPFPLPLRGDAGTQLWGPGCSFTPEVVAAHRAVQLSGCEPWLLKDSCHPELDSGGGKRSGEGGATPSGW